MPPDRALVEIDYTPTEADLIALARHQIALSAEIQGRLRRMHVGYVIAFSLLAVGAYLVLPNEVVSISFAAFASLALLLYPSCSRWRLYMRLPGLVRRRATPASYAARKLRAQPDGLEQITEDIQSRVDWRAVDAVFETPKYAFLSIDGSYTIAIPRERISPSKYGESMDTVREYRVTADRPASVPAGQ